MAEYLEREAVLNILSQKNAPWDGYQKVSELPVADVQPLEYGEWTAEGNDEIGNYWDECTVCRRAVFFPPSVKNDYKYCPHCGARMDGAE